MPNPFLTQSAEQLAEALVEEAMPAVRTVTSGEELEEEVCVYMHTHGHCVWAFVCIDRGWETTPVGGSLLKEEVGSLM